MQRISLLFQLTTNPTNLSNAIPHTGGWSESTWIAAGAPTSMQTYLANWAQIRAIMLPGQAAIVGGRLANYTLSGNRLLPGGTSNFKFLVAGNSNYGTDVPQMALELGGSSGALPNANRFTLRGIPDAYVVYGEYQPDPNFKAAVTKYINFLTGGRQNVQGVTSGFIGRVLNNPVGRVQTVVAAAAGAGFNMTVTLSQDVGGTINQDYLRFHRVSDVNGNPIKGTYLIIGKAANVYTLQGTPNQNVTKPSGTARIDLLNLYPYTTIAPSRILVRKVGRPFQGYRGRASARTPA